MLRKFIICSLFLIMPVQANETIDPRDLLKQMVQTARSESYKGILLINNKELETISLQHFAAQDSTPEQERLVSLDGVRQEVVVDGIGMSLYLPKDQEAPLLRNPFTDTFVKDISAFDHYTISLLGKTRVAGRQTYLLEIKPKDKWLYSYKIWLSKKDLMYVKAQWFDKEVMVSEAALLSIENLSPHKALVAKPQYKGLFSKTVQVGNEERKCRVQWVPEGFVMLSRTAYPPEGPGKTEHLVFGDGLSKVSVYVDVAADVAVEDSELGRTNIYTRPLGDNKKVVVVGEVPLTTIRKIAESVELPE